MYFFVFSSIVDYFVYTSSRIFTNDYLIYKIEHKKNPIRISRFLYIIVPTYISDLQERLSKG